LKLLYDGGGVVDGWKYASRALDLRGCEKGWEGVWECITNHVGGVRR